MRNVALFVCAPPPPIRLHSSLYLGYDDDAARVSWERATQIGRQQGYEFHLFISCCCYFR